MKEKSNIKVAFTSFVLMKKGLEPKEREQTSLFIC